MEEITIKTSEAKTTKKPYQKPEIEITQFEIEDITCSGLNGGDGADWSDW